jgi:hypothetical protein
MNGIDAHPLCWPVGRPRTNRWSREDARFRTTFAVARDNIIREVKLLIGNRYVDPDVIISTNIPLRRDGLPYATYAKPDDPGVAVYFTYKKQQRCFACDRWKSVEQNMQAVCKTIEALRGISRWGTGDMMEAAFTGFTALPPPAAKKGWRDVFGYVGPNDLASVERTYRYLRSANHPDRGGSADRFHEITKAWEEAQRELA